MRKMFLLIAVMALISVGFVFAEVCTLNLCDNPSNNLVVNNRYNGSTCSDIGCGACNDTSQNGAPYGYCQPGESERVPELSTIGIGALIIAGLAAFLIMKKR